MTERSKLPFGSEFSPSQIELSVLLDLLADHNGNSKMLQSAILRTFFSDHSRGNLNNQTKLAMNCRLGLKAYGIIDAKAKMTALGQELYTLKDNSTKLYEALARHIILHLGGMKFIQCIRDMTAAGDIINLTTLRKGLAERGIYYPSGGKHPSIMRLWLAKAGIFVGSRWQIDELRLSEISKTGAEDFGVLERLSPEQQAFLLALVNTQIYDPQPANEIVKLAQATYGIPFPEKSLPKLVLKALVDAGYILITKTTAGRGAKPFMVRPTKKLESCIIAPLLKQAMAHVDPKLLDFGRKSFAEILTKMRSKNSHTAGLALEALAFKLMLLLDMKYVATRLRAQATGGAEVDLIFESARLVFSRWQIQCKNTPRVSLDDVAKEVGLTHFLRSNVIIIVSTGKIGSEARRYANKIMTDSNLCIVMIDHLDLDRIKDTPTRIVDIFKREANHAMALKDISIQGNIR